MVTGDKYWLADAIWVYESLPVFISFFFGSRAAFQRHWCSKRLFHNLHLACCLQKPVSATSGKLCFSSHCARDKTGSRIPRIPLSKPVTVPGSMGNFWVPLRRKTLCLFSMHCEETRKRDGWHCAHGWPNTNQKGESFFETNTRKQMRACVLPCPCMFFWRLPTWKERSFFRLKFSSWNPHSWNSSTMNAPPCTPFITNYFMPE